MGEPERQRVGGGVPASYWDYGLRLDIGAYWGVAAGRFAFQTDREGAFRRRYASTWYVKTFLYLGATWGDSAKGGIGWLARDAWTGVRRLFHRTRKEEFIED